MARKKIDNTFRITSSRRDFLRLVCNSTLHVNLNRGQFVFYKIKGQVHKKLSKRNFARFVANDYLDHVATNNDGTEQYVGTEKARNIVFGKDLQGGEV